MKVPLIFENSEVVVINKPAGVVVHADAHYRLEDSVAGWFLEYCGKQVANVGQEGRPGIVHRLDKPTSGVMVLAKTQEAYENLVGQFKRREVTKEYVALVWGDVVRKLEIRNKKYETKLNLRNSNVSNLRNSDLGFVSNFDICASNFVIDAPIARHPGDPTKFAVVEGGREAVTEFVVEQVTSEVTLLKARPITGRAHQIRVHLKALGHPIVGDAVYQTKKQQQWFKEFCRHSGGAEATIESQQDPISYRPVASRVQGDSRCRLHLHAIKLGFRVPPEGQFQLFDAPLPGKLEWWSC